MQLKFGVWRWYSPVNLVDGDDNEDPPSAIVPRILSLTGYSSLSELMGAMNDAQRNELPESLHAKLLRIFCADRFEDEEFTFREIEIYHDDESITLPYPCRPEKLPEVDLKIAAFNVSEKSKKRVKVGARIGASTDHFLVPATPGDAAFCKLFLLRGKSLMDDLSGADREVLKAWLVGHGVDSTLAESALDSEDFKMDLSNQILDRIEEIISIVGASALSEEGADTRYLLEGDEEKGFSAAETGAVPNGG